MVVSGDGEEILYRIGKKINQSINNYGNFEGAIDIEEFKKAKGNWIAGYLDEEDICNFVTSDKEPLDYDDMPVTTDLFPILNKFDVFENSDLTAHTMSYLSSGCVHNCFFCSESSKINGKLKQTKTAATRMYKNLEAIQQIGKQKYNTDNMSAFIEDSILLSGNPSLLNHLSQLLEENPLNVEFGGQFTIDTLLETKTQDAVRKLSEQGLKYIFLGLETNKEEIAVNINKNKNAANLSWMEKNEQVVEFIKEQDIKYGVSLLFGLGENQEDRISLMKTIQSWQEKYGIPNVVSMNLAVQHPLRYSEEYDYVDWGTNVQSEYLEIFTEIFGEASEKYKLPNVVIPSVEELNEIKEYYYKIQSFDKVEKINQEKEMEV